MGGEPVKKTVVVVVFVAGFLTALIKTLARLEAHTSLSRQKAKRCKLVI